MVSMPSPKSEQFDLASEGKMRRRLREVLLRYFPAAGDVRSIVMECFSKELEHVAGGKNYEEVLYELISWLWCDPNARLKPFLEAAKRDRPGAAQELDAVAGALMQASFSLSAADLRDTIQQFLDELADRKDLFRFLNAYKGLHEVIHQLKLGRSRIDEAISRRMVDPSLPLADDAAWSFDEWAERATQCISETEFPDDPPDWIQSMSAAASTLRGPEPSRWPWAMEKLQAIPAREMGRLNGKLIDTARRLRCEHLIEYLDAILAATAASKKNSKVADIDARVTRFRSLCVQLVQLVRMHDLCQRIDDLLGEAAGLVIDSPSRLMGWSNINRRLNELMEVCPNDFRAKRAWESAQKFAAAQDDATGRQQFVALTERFADLFHETDRSLLSFSNRIGNEVFSLDKELRNFL